MNIYMLKDHINGNQQRKFTGKIYHADENEARQLIEAGYAVKVDFPTLEEHRNAIRRAVELYRKQAAHIHENAALGPTEKQYRIAGLQADLEETVAAIKKKYAVELEAQTIAAAQKAVKSEQPTDQAREYVDGIELAAKSGTPAALLAEMIALQLPTLDGPTKAELLRRIDQFPDEVKALAPKLRDNTAQLNYQILKAIQNDWTVDSEYRTLKAVHFTYKDGYLSREISAQFENDRLYKAEMERLKGGDKRE